MQIIVFVSNGPGFALVLGGAGITGIAWMVGLLHGLRARGVDLTRPDEIIGTSGGAIVGCHIACDTTLDALVAQQSAPYDAATEPPANPDPEVRPRYEEIAARHPAPRPRSVRLEMCRLALAARTIPEAERLAAIRKRIPAASGWPATPFSVISVRARDGAVVAWTRHSGLSLLHAIASSCALPGYFPPTTIGGERYVDGGVASPVSAGLATRPRVIVIAPTGDRPTFPDSLSIEVAHLEARGVRVVPIVPDAQAMTILGPNRMDPTRRRAALAEGERQAAAVPVDTLAS